ncbi:hypothetical protein B0J14DRAFT_619917 [Halenospora varia]|nr:hypothetical protein B0J14DRAFT_619917 [Halenospora varia]
MAAPPMPDILPYPTGNNPSSSDDNPPPRPPPPGLTIPPIHPPFPITFPPITFPRLKSVRTGAWLVNYSPVGSTFVAYDGTIRVEATAGGRRASGDLYQRPTIRIPFPVPRTIMLPPPNPSNGIPIQPIKQYRYYLRVTKILENITFGKSFDLGLQMFLFTPTSAGSGTWSPAPAAAIDCTATMTWIPAPAGYPSSGDYLEGDLKQDGTNTILGRFKMGWLSQYFRKAVVEIDTVAGSEQPLDSGNGHNWQTRTRCPPPTGEGWSDSEMNDAMIKHHEAVNLDLEWHYHILAVHLIDSTPRGIMYDAGATDSDHIPREDLGISTHWTIDQGWGTVSGIRFGLAKAPHFRTAVHELGHALGLYHNTVDLGYMNTSDVIARAGTAALPFPANIKWAFADNDLKRLRHFPDIFIRPGGVPFGEANDINPPLTPDDRALMLDMPELKLEITPLLTEVPLGAPVRVELKLTNTSDMEVTVPARIDLKSTCVHGVVKDASGTARNFKSIIGCVDEEPLTQLAPKESVSKSLTLLRGGDGALFPMSGVSEISVTLRWALPSAGEAGEQPLAIVIGSAAVFITGASSGSHAKAAHKVLTCPDAHLILALGATHLTTGVEAVEAAVANDVLGKHWNVVKAKALAKAGGKENGRKLLGDKHECVMSHDEKDKLERLLK